MTLVDRVSVLEEKVDNNHHKLQTNLDALRSKFHSMHAGLMENMDILLQNWVNQERDHKEKGMAKEPTSSVESGQSIPDQMEANKKSTAPCGIRGESCA